MTWFWRSIILATTLATSSAAQSIEEAVAKAASDAPQFALGVAVAGADGVVDAHTYGPVRKGATESVAPDAPWHIGSITKSFTATLVMQQVDRGVLDLRAPIGDYLTDETDMDPSWRALTLQQLLSHTAGLPANAGIMSFRKRGNDNLHHIRQTVLSTMWAKPVTPGSYSYSNVGYVLAGYILESVTGQTWEDQIRSDIAEPLGLASLGFGAPVGDTTARGHRNYMLFNLPVAPDSKGADNPPWIGPAGNLHLNLDDLVTWGQTHLAVCRGEKPDFLSQASCRTMQTIVSDNYGLGWVMMDDGRVWHNGSNTMWYAVLSLDPNTDRVIAVTTNVAQMGRIDALVAELQKIE